MVNNTILLFYINEYNLFKIQFRFNKKLLLVLTVLRILLVTIWQFQILMQKQQLH